MRIKDRECGFVSPIQAFSVGKAHDVPAILVSLLETSHLLASYLYGCITWLETRTTVSPSEVHVS